MVERPCRSLWWAFVLLSMAWIGQTVTSALLLVALADCRQADGIEVADE